MVAVQRTIEVCDRDAFGREQAATEERTFAIDDMWYELKLCRAHAEMFDRDLGVWTRLAKDIDPPSEQHKKSVFFTDEVKAETARIRELTEKAREKLARDRFVAERRAQIEAENIQGELADANAAWRSIPGAMNWKLSTHAHERAEERHFSLRDVFQAAATPQHTYGQPWRGPEVAVHQHGDCRVIVDAQRKVIITVMDRTSELETQPPERRTAL